MLLQTIGSLLAFSSLLGISPPPVEATVLPKNPAPGVILTEAQIQEKHTPFTKRLKEVSLSESVIVSIDIPWDGSQEEVAVTAAPPPPPPPAPEPEPEPEEVYTDSTASLPEEVSALAASLGVPSDSIVSTALQYVGYSYIYGGSSPSTGFDCSGFTSYIYGLHGYSLPRTSSQQGNVGTWVSQEDALPGDLVAWSHGGHVAIYLGNGKIVHASTPSTGVVIGDLYGSYYFKRL